MSSSRSSTSRRPNASLFVKGLNLSTTADDLKDLFTRYGPVQDVYLPLDYYTREPRGFSYVQFEDIRDAEDAFHYLDGTRLHGRELEIQYAEGDRKTPGQMRGKEHGGRHGGRGYDRRRSRSSSPRRRRRSYSPRKRSRSPRRSRSPYSPKKRTRRSRSRSNSRSPPSGGRSRSRSYSRSPSR